MSVSMSLLAILEETAGHGFQLKNEFEERTGGIWPLNVGQVYTTLSRLERDGLVRQQEGPDGQKLYAITEEGRGRVRAWFGGASPKGAPERDEVVLKLVMAAGRGDVHDVIQGERKGAVSLLQQYTRLKQDAGTGQDIGWLFLLDSLIFAAEARVRWLDACEARLERRRAAPRRATAPEETAVEAVRSR